MVVSTLPRSHSTEVMSLRHSCVAFVPEPVYASHVLYVSIQVKGGKCFEWRMSRRLAGSRVLCRWRRRALPH